MRKLAPFFAAITLLLVASLTPAQNAIPHNRLSIDAGNVNFTGSSLDPQGRFIFAGQGLALSGELREGNFSPDCVPCVGGDQIQIHTVYSGELSIRPGTMTVSGTSRDVFYSGDLEATAAPVTLPIRYSRAPFRVTVPITLHGFLDVYERDPFITTNYWLFRVPINLQGTATLTLNAWGFSPSTGRPYYRFRSLSYEF
jgi:hypothetical protein